MGHANGVANLQFNTVGKTGGYNVFGNVEWDEIPLFITNKAISITIIFLLLFSIQKNSSSSTKKKIWKIIFILSSIHVFISFRLLGFTQILLM